VQKVDRRAREAERQLKMENEEQIKGEMAPNNEEENEREAIDQITEEMNQQIQ